jgi:putative flippase GtrA
MARVRARLADLASRPATRFLAFSALGYAVDLTLLLVLQREGLLPRWANVAVAFWITYGLNFGLNRWFAFHAAHRDLRGQLGRYLPQVLIDFGLTLAGVELLAGVLGLPLIAARMLAAGTNAAFNYAAYRWWTFSDRRPRAVGPGQPAPGTASAARSAGTSTCA